MDLLYTAHVPAGDGPFPTVVALHGYGAPKAFVQPLAEELPAELDRAMAT